MLNNVCIALNNKSVWLLHLLNDFISTVLRSTVTEKHNNQIIWNHWFFFILFVGLSEEQVNNMFEFSSQEESKQSLHDNNIK